MAYTTIDDPSAHFQIALYTGNQTARSITNDGNSDLQPDWVWDKNRDSSGYHHNGYDSSRGVGKQIRLNKDDAEINQAQGVTAFNSDGFSLGTDDSSNKTGDKYVAWQWKANGGTTTTNDASATSVGDTDSAYQVNSTAKFSIVGWTGSGSGSVNIAHGLGSTPKFILTKQRGGANSNLIYHHKNTVADDPHDSFLKMNNNSASGADDNNYFMNNTAPTSTVVTFGNGNEANQSGTYIGYFFDEVQGYSKFGTYTGNGENDGPFTYTGFKPAWIMIKRTDSSSNWNIHDIKRNIDNPSENILLANDSAAEATTSNAYLDILSNGFKCYNGDASQNANGGTYIYMAFAEHPFVSSKGVPTTAR
jgi:hypothetical protein